MQPLLRSRVLFGIFLLLAALGPAAALTPIGEPIPVMDRPSCDEEHLDIAGLPGGGFTAVWTQHSPSQRDVLVMARVFGADGAPLAPPRIAVRTPNVHLEQPVVAADATGKILIAWYDRYLNEVRFRLFTAALEPLGEERTLSASSRLLGLDAAAPRGGGFAVVLTGETGTTLWHLGPEGEILTTQPLPATEEYRFGDAAAHRLAPHGRSGLVAVWSVSLGRTHSIEARILTAAPSSPFTVGVVQASPSPYNPSPQPGIASGAAGTFLVTWRGLVDNDPAIFVRAFDDDGQFLTGPLRLDHPDEKFLSAPEVVADSAGGFLVLWQSSLPEGRQGTPALSIQRLAVDGGAVGGAQRFPTRLATLERPEAVIDGADRLTVSWGSTDPGDGIGFECPRGGELTAWRFDASPGPVRLQGDRFEIHARWTDHAGNTGEATGVAVTGDSGFLWFFDPNNIEIMVKVLDGRAVNGHFWVFYASLSDVAYTLTVTDTVTGESRSYDNPAGQLASRADTSAFSAVFLEAAPAGASPAFGADATQARQPVLSSPPADDPVPLGPCTDPGSPVYRRPGLCLQGRFEVEVIGSAFPARGRRLTEDSGYLWFFSPDNIELVVKVLDGRPINGHFWVFYGALTDVEHTLRVRDILTGAERIYHNPAGQMASRADTEAL